MGQYVSWLANSLLFVLCCYMVADTTNEVFAALLTPEPADAVRPVAPAAFVPRAWSDREVILERNLFNASLLRPPPPTVVEPDPTEDLAATKLPLKLLGTAAAVPAEASWAAVVDQSARRTVIVGINDKLNKATVKRIERRRLVLSEGGKLRELVLDEGPAGGAKLARLDLKNLGRKNPRGRKAGRPKRTPPKPKIAPRVQKIDDDRFQVNRDDIDDMMTNPTNLFSEARILPKYENGSMVGLQINAIKAGSLFEDIGIESGDVITKLNGINIDNPQESAKVLSEFSEAENFTVEVERSDGSNDTLEFSIDE